MSVHLSRRVTALEESLSHAGRIIPVWSMKPDGQVMTDKEIDQEIAARKAAGAPANARYLPFRWLTEGEAERRDWASGDAFGGSEQCSIIGANA